MRNIEARDKKMLKLADRYYSERRLLAFLSIIMVIGLIAALSYGQWQHGPLGEAKILGGTITVVLILLAYSVHLKIKHIESIQYYLNKSNKEN